MTALYEDSFGLELGFLSHGAFNGFLFRLFLDLLLSDCRNRANRRDRLCLLVYLLTPCPSSRHGRNRATEFGNLSRTQLDREREVSTLVILLARLLPYSNLGALGYPFLRYSWRGIEQVQGQRRMVMSIETDDLPHDPTSSL